jgi:hypothetical protein
VEEKRKDEVEENSKIPRKLKILSDVTDLKLRLSKP